jgi:hypothetical protein
MFNNYYIPLKSQFVLVDGEHLHLLPVGRVCQIRLGQLRYGEVDSADGLGEVVERGVDQVWVLHVAPGLVPLLVQVEVLELLREDLLALLLLLVVAPLDDALGEVVLL